VREPGVSAVHARLIAKAGIFFIEDLGSAHGTWVNERRLQADEVAALQYGDRIVLGKTSVRFGLFEQHWAEADL
jgi:pSer/pThr/pTyr-binding forkhead associated (FHA) protein